ncbi:MAG TPA: carbohydrate kinase family protein [Anaerolineales bacterium]|nr:carbohydrate kinase family protein [Anaerolineales bacterium]
MLDSPGRPDEALPREGPVLVIGASGLDLVGRAEEPLRLGTSNPARVRLSFGGVGRNVAANLASLGTEVTLLTAVGDDDRGRQLLDETARAGVDVAHTLVVEGARTGAYLALLNDQGNLHLAFDDMRVVQSITPEFLLDRKSLFLDAQAVFVDANLSPATLAAAVGMAKQAGAPVAADPTSVGLATRLLPLLADLWLITPNEAEAQALAPQPIPHPDRNPGRDVARHLVAKGVRIAVVTMAEFGVAYATAEVSGHVPAHQTEIVDPTGAGDALTAAVIFALLNDIPVDEAVKLGAVAGALTLRTKGTVVPNLSVEMLYDQLR